MGFLEIGDREPACPEPAEGAYHRLEDERIEVHAAFLGDGIPI